jgi:glycerophosphoryl diester phosphodiesterase
MVPFQLFYPLIGLLIFLLLPMALPPHTTSLRQVLEHELGRTGEEYPSYRCTIGAHRGSSVVFRENTISALKAAEDDPFYNFIEFDVQYTKDRQLVLFHDRRLLRLFGKLRSVGKSTYAELLQLSGGEIALYNEAMKVLHEKKLNIEIKSQGDDREDEQLADAIIADIRARGRENDVMVSSISSKVISYVKKKYPGVKTGQIFWLTWSTYVHLDMLTEGLYEKFSESQADYLLLYVANLRNIEGLLKLKPPGKTIVFWDFDDRMYLVHKDRTDRLWGTSIVANTWQNILFLVSWTTRRPLQRGF